MNTLQMVLGGHKEIQANAELMLICDSTGDNEEDTGQKETVESHSGWKEGPHFRIPASVPLDRRVKTGMQVGRQQAMSLSCLRDDEW